MWCFSVYANTVIDLRYIYEMKTICRATDEPGFKLQVSSMMEPCSWIKKHVLSVRDFPQKPESHKAIMQTYQAPTMTHVAESQTK